MCVPSISIISKKSGSQHYWPDVVYANVCYKHIVHHDGCLMIGDFIGRFGNTMPDLPICLKMQHLSHPGDPDQSSYWCSFHKTNTHDTQDCNHFKSFTNEDKVNMLKRREFVTVAEVDNKCFGLRQHPLSHWQGNK